MAGSSHNLEPLWAFGTSAMDGAMVPRDDMHLTTDMNYRQKNSRKKEPFATHSGKLGRGKSSFGRHDHLHCIPVQCVFRSHVWTQTLKRVSFHWYLNDWLADGLGGLESPQSGYSGGFPAAHHIHKACCSHMFHSPLSFRTSPAENG